MVPAAADAAAGNVPTVEWLELEYDEVPQIGAVDGDGRECRCGEAARRGVVIGERNDRSFYRCGICGFFEWDGDDDESEDA